MNKKPLVYLPLLSLALVLGFAIYTFVALSALTGQVASLSEHLLSLNDQVASSTKNFYDFKNETETNFRKQSSSIGYVEDKVGYFRDQVGSVSTTVSSLEKLSKIDPQLLAKYSKVFFLSENYAPARLSEVPNAFRYSSTKAVSVESDILIKLEQMINDARNDGVNLFVQSAYRSFAEQKNLKSDYSVVYGAGTANSFSADQGYSEHQLGTAIDFTTTGLGGGLDGFEKTTAYSWLLENAFRYGFVLSYPLGNSYYEYEPWHWRYVGVKLATDLHAVNQHFYDWDQRKIDTYLVNIFD